MKHRSVAACLLSIFAVHTPTLKAESPLISAMREKMAKEYNEAKEGRALGTVANESVSVNVGSYRTWPIAIPKNPELGALERTLGKLPSDKRRLEFQVEVTRGAPVIVSVVDKANFDLFKANKDYRQLSDFSAESVKKCQKAAIINPGDYVILVIPMKTGFGDAASEVALKATLAAIE